jgi:hypothetical protein
MRSDRMTDQSLTAEPSQIWYGEALDLLQGAPHLGCKLVHMWESRIHILV